MRQYIDNIKKLALQKSTDQQQISRLFQNINDTLGFGCDANKILGHISSRDLSFLIYNISQLAIYSQVRINATTLNNLFAKILLSNNLDASILTHCLYGAGKIAKAGPIRGVLNLQFIQALVAQLKSSRPNSQEIANTIWGLGKLAEAQILEGALAPQDIQALVAQLKSSSPHSQGIANTIWGLGKLAEAQILEGALAPQDIQALVAQLKSSSPHSQGIANTIWGLGKLAEAQILEGALAPQDIQALVAQLKSSRPHSQGIANTIWGLGKLAEAQILEGALAPQDIQALVTQLKSGRPHSQEIANTIWGLGKLAEAQILEGALTTQDIQALVTQLKSGRPHSQEIAKTIWGLGKLAEAQILEGALTTQDIQALVAQLKSSRPHSQEIANTIWGLGKLAHAQILEGALVPQDIQALVTQLKSSRPNSQDIANTIWGLGKLAHAQILEGALAPQDIQALVAQLKSSRPHSQHIANTIWGLGKLAEAQILEGALAPQDIQALVAQLKSSSPHSQGIANTIWGLGKLTEAQILEGALTTQDIQALVTQLKSSRPNSQEIANTIWGLGKLAEDRSLENALVPQDIQALVAQLKSSRPNSQEIANTIWGLGKLLECHLLKLEILTELPISGLLTPVDMNNLALRDCCQLIYGLSYLQANNPNLINGLFTKVLESSYTHPSQAIIHLTYYLSFKAYQALNEDILTQLITRINLPFTTFNSQNQEKLKHIISQLPPNLCLMLKEQLNLLPPKPISRPQNIQIKPNKLSAHMQTALNNRIFKAIYDNDLATLERLLGIHPFSPKATLSPSAAGRRFNFNPTPRVSVARVSAEVKIDNKKTADGMVFSFLENTPAEALKTLIAGSKHLYFIQMLRACSKHQQYQFAINNHLHLIMIHLPSQEIENMVNELISLGFYRDHRATLSLIEGLYIRKIAHPETSALLTTLQQELLKRSIEFHQQHHPRVSNKLQTININMLLTEENDNILRAPAAKPTPAILEEHSLFTPAAASSQTPTAAKDSHHHELQHLDGTPNMLSYYGSEHVNQLLEATLEAHPNILILAAFDFHQAEEVGQVLVQQLLEYIGQHSMPEPHHFIIPICIHLHWVGLRVQVRDKQIDVTYYDSLTGQALRPQIIPPMQAALTEFYNKPMNLREINQYQQDDNYSCGAYLIENIRVDVCALHYKKLVWAETLRTKHLDMLNTIAENKAEAHQNKRRKYDA